MCARAQSSYPMRVQRCQEIFQLARQQNPSLSKFLNDTLSLCDKLLELCNRPTAESHVMYISKNMESLHRLLKQP